MKDYYRIILDEFLRIYERRGLFIKIQDTSRIVQIVPEKMFKEYADQYNHESYRDINVAIEKIVQERNAEAVRDATGKYTKVKLNLSRIEEVYRITKRLPIPLMCEKMRNTILGIMPQGKGLLTDFCEQQLILINDYKKLPYEIGYDNERLEKVVITLKAILNLRQETYIRNFSTALNNDSKEFQKNMRKTIQNILYDYTDTVVEKERILEMYNLFDNPTYVMIKGNAIIEFKTTRIILPELSGGIAFPNSALESIRRCEVCADKVITVENLTTFHDTDEADGVIIYLGGFHNASKQKLLELIFLQNKEKLYFHKGDLDVYGFAILENLRGKTGIPFEPLEMDIETLSKFYHCGLYKNLTDADRKAMKSKKLEKYKNIFEYMIQYDCKVEQESVKAVDLISKE